MLKCFKYTYLLKFLNFTDYVHDCSSILRQQYSWLSKTVQCYAYNCTNISDIFRTKSQHTPLCLRFPPGRLSYMEKNTQKLNSCTLLADNRLNKPGAPVLTNSLNCNYEGRLLKVHLGTTDWMQQVWLIAERHEAKGVWVYLLGAIPVDHGWWWWWSQDWEFRAEKLAGLQRWGVVCHVSLIHTTEEVLLQQRHSDQWKCSRSARRVCGIIVFSLHLWWELHLPRMSTGWGFSLPSPIVHYEHMITYICIIPGLLLS